VLFFGLFSVAPSPENFSADAIEQVTRQFQTSGNHGCGSLKLFFNLTVNRFLTGN